MEYVQLGNSGLKVSKIILGTMQYGSKGWQDWVLEEDEAIKHIRFAYDITVCQLCFDPLIIAYRYENGIQTFDTSNYYSNGLSEIILGNAIKKLNLPREELVIMTKLYFPIPTGNDYDTNILASGKAPEEFGLVNQWGNSRKHISASVKASLGRLQLDYIDLLQLHRFDYNTPIEETMQALHDVVKAGHVRYIGMSSCYAYQFHQMQNYAISNKLTPYISMQNHHSLIYREEEREMFPTLKLFGVGAIPWSPLGRGILTRPLKKQSLRGETDWYLQNYKGPTIETIVNRVQEVANKKGISIARVSVAWSLSKDFVTAPIVGTTKLDNLKDILGGLQVKLTEDEIKYLEEPYIPQAVLGHS